MKPSILFCGFALAAACPVHAQGAFVLASDGAVRCRVSHSGFASRPERFGASELALYIARVTGSAQTPPVPYDGAPRKGDLRVRVRPSAEITLDGFIVESSPDGVTVTGGSPRGALFGCYWLLRKYAGLRWLVPGDDGEYYRPLASIAVPFGRTVENPSTPIRTVAGLSSDELHLWCVRNGMQPRDAQAAFTRPGEKGRLRRARLEDLAVAGSGRGGHVLTELMLGFGRQGATIKQVAEEFYAEHPDWFPLIKGERRLIWGAFDPNPCVSNPSLLDRMGERLLLSAAADHGSDMHVIIGNNDTSIWCECDKCRALDNPAAAGTRGARSDRFWYMVNELAGRVWKKRPDVKLGGWAYQDFWYPPTKVAIDPRLRVLISFNNQCWRHSVDDETCAVNGEFRRIFGMWKKTGLEVYNRDEIADEGSPGRYAPSERIVCRNIRAYPRYGCAGDQFFVYSPFPPTLKWAEKLPPYFGRNLCWRAMWQTMYLAAQVQWDAEADVEALYEECNSLYYGKAWDGGMREFRAELTRLFTATPGCIGYGSGASLGKCLDEPGSQERLVALLDKATACARASGDRRALAHLETDRDIFALTWLAERKRYVENYREYEAKERTSEIRIDGVLDEPDWRAAAVLGGFKHKYETKPPEPAKEPTEVLVTYDLDHLYIAVTAYEPAMDRIIAGKPEEVDRANGWSNLGNRLELFYQFPDMYEKAFQLAINSEGAIVDGIQKSASERDIGFRTKARWAVAKHKDRWILEIAIPCDEIGSKCMKGMVWKLNVARYRVTSDMKRGWGTSCSNGHFHGPSNFVNIRFARGGNHD